MNFTEEEKDMIDQAIIKIVEDLRDILKESGLDEINVKLKANKSFNPMKQKLLKIRHSEVKIGNFTLYEKYDYKLSRDTDTPDIFYKNDLEIIKNYERIREQVLKTLQKRMEEKKHNIEVCDSIIGTINKKKQSGVIIDFPESINQHTIEISEENGKKIGTIDFGDHVVQIITSSEIEVVRKDEQPKQKRIIK